LKSLPIQDKAKYPLLSKEVVIGPTTTPKPTTTSKLTITPEATASEQPGTTAKSEEGIPIWAIILIIGGVLLL
jgi:hypothetical protein